MQSDSAEGCCARAGKTDVVRQIMRSVLLACVWLLPSSKGRELRRPAFLRTSIADSKGGGVRFRPLSPLRKAPSPPPTPTLPSWSTCCAALTLSAATNEREVPPLPPPPSHPVPSVPKRSTGASTTTRTRRAAVAPAPTRRRKTTTSTTARKSSSSTSRRGAASPSPTPAPKPVPPVTDLPRRLPDECVEIISWNVNGLRANLRNGGIQTLLEEHPHLDFLCLQETRVSPDTPLPEFDAIRQHFPYCYFHCAARAGYSGTAVLSKTPPLRVLLDINLGGGEGGEEDKEGRVVTWETESFFLLSVYSPNAQGELQRLEYKHRQWNPAFFAHIERLRRQKPVVIAGDLNVAHTPKDLFSPLESEGLPGYTPEERSDFSDLLATGYVDTFRNCHPDMGGAYSWFSYRYKDKQRNRGWRIDYVLVSDRCHDAVKGAYIEKSIDGSDHVPVGVVLNTTVLSAVCGATTAKGGGVKKNEAVKKGVGGKGRAKAKAKA